MTTYTWTSTSDGFWFTTTNWTPTGTPVSGDTAIISNAGTYTITVGTGNATITNLTFLSTAANASLTFTNSHNLTLLGVLTLGGGSINVNASATGITSAKNGTSSLLISGGTLLESNGSVGIGTGGVTISAGSAALSNGSFTDTGALSVTGGTFTLNGATAAITGGASFTGGGSTIQSGKFTANSLTVGGTGNTVTFSGGSITTNSGGTGASVQTGDTLSMSGNAILDLSNGGGSFAGTVTGSGTIDGTLSGSGGTGVVKASGATLDLTSAVSSSSGIAFQIGSTAGSVLKLDSTVGVGNTFSFASGSGALELATPSGNTFSGVTISGMNVNSTEAATNEIDVRNVVFTKAVLSATDAHGGTLTLMNGASQVGIFNLTNTTGADLTTGFVDWQSDGSGGQNIFLSTVVCFAAGTRILTPRGPVAVEDLAEGDSVVTHTGAEQPVTWIGHRRIDLTLHPRPQLVAPVRIRRYAFGESLPQRDLLVSPDHCLFVDGKLIPAKLLINGMTIVHELATRSVQYFHVELDRHAILLAEGLPAESYLDTGNRAYFSNASQALVLHPEFTVNAGLKTWETDACAPLTVQQEAVAPIWQRLADRAAALGFVAPQAETTQDPALHLLVDGRSVSPMSVQPGRYVFALPAGSDSVRLVSRSGMPSALRAYVDDWRDLGVAVTRVEVRGQDSHAVIPADHPALARGWHTIESDGATSWRWTDGNAELRLDPTGGPALVEVHVCNTASYILPRGDRLAA